MILNVNTILLLAVSSASFLSDTSRAIMRRQSWSIQSISTFDFLGFIGFLFDNSKETGNNWKQIDILATIS